MREVIILNGEIKILNDEAFLGCDDLERFKFPSLSTRLDNIIQAGQRGIEAKMDNIPSVEWRAGELVIPAVRREIEKQWGMETVAELDKEKLAKVEGLIAYFEVSSRGIIVKSASSDLTFGPFTPSGGVFTFGQSLSHTSNNNDGVCEINDKLQNMNTADIVEETVLVCANCGKEGDDVNNICNKCKQVKYCNASCKKKHKKKHKKECEEHIRLAAERAAELHDEKLFKQPPPTDEDCPICFERLPTLNTGRRYQSCCGKLFAVDVYTLLCLMTKAIKLIIKSVNFVELRMLLQTRK